MAKKVKKMKSAKNKQKTRISFSLLIVASLLFLTISSSIQVSAANPKQRISHNMIYDSVNDRIIMYGGLTATGESYRVFDTWSYYYDTNEWTQLITDNNPYASNAKIAYDSESEKIISFGGSHADHVESNQTWIYDFNDNTWTQSIPSNVPIISTSELPQNFRVKVPTIIL